MLKVLTENIDKFHKMTPCKAVVSIMSFSCNKFSIYDMFHPRMLYSIYLMLNTINLSKTTSISGIFSLINCQVFCK